MTRRQRNRSLLLSLFGWLSAIASLAPALAADKPGDEVAILFSVRAGLPVTDNIHDAFVEAFQTGGIERGKIFTEYLDLARPMDVHQRAELTAFIRHKFAERNFSLLVAVHRRAYEFLANEGRHFAPHLPVIAWAGSAQTPTPINRPGLRILEHPSPRTTVDLALRLFPHTRHLLIVTGVDEPLNPYLEELKKNLGILPDRLTIEFTADKSFEETLARIAELPADSVVIYGSYWLAADGQAISPFEAARQVAVQARVPAFAITWDRDVGEGFLGGYVVDSQATARRVATATINFMAGKTTFSTPMSVLPAVNRFVFDWRQMQRWSIDSSSLPADSLILNRPKHDWQRHQSGLMLLMVVTLTIGLALSVRNCRRRTASDSNSSPSNAQNAAGKNRQWAEHLATTHQRLLQMSFVDELTGLANRRRMEEGLEQECQRANRSGQPLSLIMIDVDHFKLFNDTYGHLSGDDCLQTLAEIFNSVVQRPADLTCRFGGEEFLLILPETPHRGAIEIVQALHAEIAKCAIPHLTSPTTAQITCSCGVLTVQAPPARRAHELLAAVDRQLYRAKSEGRNRFNALDLSVSPHIAAKQP